MTKNKHFLEDYRAGIYFKRNFVLVRQTAAFAFIRKLWQLKDDTAISKQITNSFRYILCSKKKMSTVESSVDCFVHLNAKPEKVVIFQN